MRALRLGPDGLELTRSYAPQPVRDNEVPLRILSAGICETDIQLARGYMGFQGVLGHEFVGIAESGPLAGQRVVGEINCPCGTCQLCRDGHGNHCPHRTVLGILQRDGAFADQTRLPAANLHAVPDNVSTEQAVFTEPLAAAFRIPEQIPLRGVERVIVLGDGRLGNLCAQVLKPRVRELLVIGKHTQKLTVLEELDISTQRLNDLQPARDWDVVVDCTGRSSGLEMALQLVRPLGTVVLKTTVADPHQLSLAPIVIDEVRVLGSRCGPFRPALQALSAREVQVEPLITGRFPFDDALAAFEQARSSQGLKTLLEMATS